MAHGVYMINFIHHGIVLSEMLSAAFEQLKKHHAFID